MPCLTTSSPAVPLVDSCHVTCLSYSPLLGGFAIVLSDGRAAFLVAATLKFDPNSVQVSPALPLEVPY